MDVLKRIGSALFPLKDFFELISGNPDLYGWFWVATTLIFAVAAAGNFASFLTYAINGKTDDWSFDFAKLGFGATLIYCYVTIVPFLAFVALKLWLELKPGILDHFCLYGYSLIPYIPAAIVMITPIGLVRWITMIVACLLVCAFLIRNYVPVIRTRPMEGGVTLLIMVLANCLFALLLQIFFFEYGVDREEESSSDSSSINSSATSASSDESSPDEDESITPTISVSISLTPSPSASLEDASPTPSPSVSLDTSSPSSEPSPTPTISPSATFTNGTTTTV